MFVFMLMLCELEGRPAAMSQEVIQKEEPKMNLSAKRTKTKLNNEAAKFVDFCDAHTNCYLAHATTG